MIRHYVFLDISTGNNNIETIKQNLQALSTKMPGCMEFEFGKCMDSPYCYFFMDFIDEAARNNYLAHPEHVRIATEVIIPRLEGGLSSVKVFDYLRSDAPPRVSRMEEGQIGYVLVKDGEEAEILAALQQHCAEINHLKPLQNVSIEELGKAHSSALKVVFKPKAGPLPKLDGGKFPILWQTPQATAPNKAEANNSDPLPPTAPAIKSRL